MLYMFLLIIKLINELINKLLTAGPPSAPSGPVRFSDITGDTVSFDWLPSKDDGGSPITSYQLLVSENATVWKDIGSVDSFQKNFKAKNLNEDTKYMFSVQAVNKVGTSSPLHSDWVIAKRPPSRLSSFYCCMND